MDQHKPYIFSGDNQLEDFKFSNYELQHKPSDYCKCVSFDLIAIRYRALNKIRQSMVYGVIPDYANYRLCHGYMHLEYGGMYCNSNDRIGVLVNRISGYPRYKYARMLFTEEKWNLLKTFLFDKDDDYDDESDDIITLVRTYHKQNMIHNKYTVRCFDEGFDDFKKKYIFGVS